MTPQTEVEAAFARHTKIAFQLSGGRDSCAALWTLRPYWGRMTVYHANTGDQYPETTAIIDWWRQHVDVTVVHSDVKKYHAEVGWPSDVLPFNGTPLGRDISGETTRIVGRLDCCWTNLMWPIHQRMLDDGITLIVRGQRDADYKKPPMRSGDTEGPIEALYPIQSWTTAEVDAYCREHGLPMAPWYAEGAAHGSDCLHCTAWWDDGRLPYLRGHHPEPYSIVRRRLDRIGEVITRQFEPLYEGIKDE